MSEIETSSNSPETSSEDTSNVAEATEESQAISADENEEHAAIEAAAKEPKKEEKKPVETPSSKKKFKLKVYGKEIEDELDFENEEEIKKRLQKAHSFDKAAAEKAELEKGIQQLVELIKSDPRKVLSHPDIGVDLKAFAQQILEEQELENQKTPEQKALEAAQRELEELRNKQKTAEEERQAAERKRLEDEFEQKITTDIKSALETVKLPYSPRAVKYMAEYMELALQNDIELSATDVAPLVKEQMRRDFNELLRVAPDELLSEFFDKDINSRLQQQRVAKVKKPVETVNSIKPTGNKPKETTQTSKPKTIAEWLRG